MDLFSKSDPFVVCYKKEGASNWREFFRTETIWNDEDPHFPDHIVIEFKFEALQPLRFEVYDRDSNSSKLSDQDYIGSFETTLSRIMGSRGTQVTADLFNERTKLSKPGQIIIKGKEISTNVDVLTFKFSAKSVERKNWFGFGRSDPFYYISQLQEDGTKVRVFTSETIMSDLSPRWRTTSLPLQRVCDADLSMPLLIEVYDWVSNGSHQFIGHFETSVEELLQLEEVELMNPSKTNSYYYTNSGTFIVENCSIQKQHSFLEYIQGGLELNLMVAIDFTASNGAPSTPKSLHHIKSINSGEVELLNEYQKAILSVGQILEDYDTDKLIPVFGFGAYRGWNSTSHCFALNFNESNPEVQGVEGILDCYSKAIRKLSLSGPTYFGPVLQRAVELAEEAEKEHKYIILLIITDGIIFDMNESIKLICKGASLPLSVIIAGVGNADFSDMDTLDGDDVRLSYRGVEAERDIVQFVPVREFDNKSYTALAEATLEELPEQVSLYFGNREIKPNLVTGEFADIGFNNKEEVVPLAEVVPK